MQANPPHIEYQQHLDRYTRRRAALERHDRQLVLAKLLLAALSIGLALYALGTKAHFAALTLPCALFVMVLVWHERILHELGRTRRCQLFYARGMARLENRWQGSGQQGRGYEHAAHLYARDLDLFGPGSLFELLCSARTTMGEETLAEWLQQSAPAAEVLLRQEAVRDLAARREFRERLFLLGDALKAGATLETIQQWSRQPALRQSAWLWGGILALDLIWVGALAVWGHGGSYQWILAATLLNLVGMHFAREGMEKAAQEVEQVAPSLKMLAHVLREFEPVSFVAPHLCELQQRLIASQASRSSLLRIVGWAACAEQRRNPLLRALDVVLGWSAYPILAIERLRSRICGELETTLRVVGELEALVSLAAFAYEHPSFCYPELIADQAASCPVTFDAQGLFHPLLPVESAVANDLLLDEAHQLLVVSGPNMAGKSTFMRSVGINAVLAQCGAPVAARRLRMTPLRVTASVCTLDSLQGGVSRFYAELKRIKEIYDLSATGAPVLFLLDELFSGTNSQDRLAATEFVAKGLVAHGGVGLISTHDLTLTRLEEELPGRAWNVHFEDQVVEGRLHFDYTMRSGKVTTSNALVLMQQLGFGIHPVPRGN